MINTPTHIFAVRLQSTEGIHEILRLLDHQKSIQLDEVYDLIHHEQHYHIIHNINNPDTLKKPYQVQGDSLCIFIQDYIEPGLGDGLDMHVFPSNGEWCLVFDIDGSITLKS